MASAFTCFYGTDWVSINLLVILLAFAIVSVVYLLSRVMPTSTKSKISGVMRAEISQIFISLFIIVILFAVTNTMCSAVGYLSAVVQQPPVIQQAGVIPFPALQMPTIPPQYSGDPFEYAETYVGSYAFEIGPSLATNIYTYSYTFGILSGIWSQVGSLISSVLPQLQSPSLAVGGISTNFSFPVAVDLGVPYTILSDALVDIFSPLAILGIGIMLVQYVGLVIVNSAAFVILLPVALILRTLPFSGGALRNASNSVLAIAIALYIIYPATIVFDSYAMSWLFTPCVGGVQTQMCNPSGIFLEGSYATNPMDELLTSSFTTTGQASTSFFGSIPFDLAQYLSEFTCHFGVCFSSDQAIETVQYLAVSLAEFLFIVVVLFAINLLITFGFAMGLTKALNSGPEGAAGFWGA